MSAQLFSLKQQHQEVSQQKQTLQQEKQTLQQQNETLQQQNAALHSDKASLEQQLRQQQADREEEVSCCWLNIMSFTTLGQYPDMVTTTQVTITHKSNMQEHLWDTSPTTGFPTDASTSICVSAS